MGKRDEQPKGYEGKHRADSKREQRRPGQQVVTFDLDDDGNVRGFGVGREQQPDNYTER